SSVGNRRSRARHHAPRRTANESSGTQITHPHCPIAKSAGGRQICLSGRIGRPARCQKLAHGLFKELRRLTGNCPVKHTHCAPKTASGSEGTHSSCKSPYRPMECRPIGYYAVQSLFYSSTG